MRARVPALFGTLPASLLLLGCGVVTAPHPSSGRAIQHGAGARALGMHATAAARIPVVFIENQGQVDPRAPLNARIGGQTIWLTDEGLLFDLSRGRRAGVTVRSGVDCLIAACAFRHGVTVLHRDRDFATSARVAPLNQRDVRVK